jgi:predicted metal-binding membrane protein
LTQLSLTEAEPAAPGLLVSGAAFLAAGLYQFSRLKQACLAVCQRPFPFFFANWAVTRAGVFRLGLRQGLHCLGCCWALMLLMLATGMLNVVWMAMLGAIMTVEKMTTSPKFSRIVGLGLLAAGAACFVAFGIGVSV